MIPPHNECPISHLRTQPPSGARIGTSSLRRQCQLQARFPNYQVVTLRGNVNTRLAKLDAGDFDIRTQTQYAVVRSLVESWERFRPERDTVAIDQGRRRAIEGGGWSGVGHSGRSALELFVMWGF